MPLAGLMRNGQYGFAEEVAAKMAFVWCALCVRVRVYICICCSVCVCVCVCVCLSDVQHLRYGFNWLSVDIPFISNVLKDTKCHHILCFSPRLSSPLDSVITETSTDEG